MSLKSLRDAAYVCILVLLGVTGTEACRPENSRDPDGRAAPPAQPHPSAAEEPACPSGLERDVVRMRPADDEGSLLVVPDPGLGDATQVWSGDVNDDEIPDVVLVFPEACGSRGECPHSVYVGCANATFIPVWGPEYAFDLWIAGESDTRAEKYPLELDRAAGDTLVNGLRWRDFVRIERTGEPEHDTVYGQIFRFDGSRYSRSPLSR